MESLLVRDWMTSDVHTVRVSDSLLAAIELMHRHTIRRIPVLDAEDHLVGMLSESDVRGVAPFSSRGRPIHDFEAILEEFVVEEQMSRSPVTISPERDLKDVVRYLLKGKFGALPVLEGGKLVGIITETDVLGAFLELLEDRPSGS